MLEKVPSFDAFGGVVYDAALDLLVGYDFRPNFVHVEKISQFVTRNKVNRLTYIETGSMLYKTTQGGKKMENAIYATAEGKKKLELKLQELIAKRSDAAEQIKIAREFGDLKENAEYAAAREAQNNLETEIGEIEASLPRVRLFSYAKADTSAVNVGTRVRLENISNKQTVEYTITGVLESDITVGKLSNESPIGSALLGRKVGEEVDVKVPAGKTKYKVLKITNGE